MAKKIKFYKACRDHEKKGAHFPENVKFIEAEGTPVEITDKNGFKVQFVLEYDRSLRSYFATELSTGLGSKPLVNKTKDELLKKLAEFDWKVLLSSVMNQKLKELLAKHKEEIK